MTRPSSSGPGRCVPRRPAAAPAPAATGCGRHRTAPSRRRRGTVRPRRCAAPPLRRLLGQEHPCTRQDRVEVQPHQGRPELAVAGQLGVEHRLHERTQHEAVVSGDEVKGGPHDDDADHAPVEEELAETLGREAVEARPQGQVRVVRHLGLQTHQVVHRLDGRRGRAVQQQLASEGGPVELAARESIRNHTRDAGRARLAS